MYVHMLKGILIYVYMQQLPKSFRHRSSNRRTSSLCKLAWRDWWRGEVAHRLIFSNNLGSTHGGVHGPKAWIIG